MSEANIEITVNRGSTAGDKAEDSSAGVTLAIPGAGGASASSAGPVNPASSRPPFSGGNSRSRGRSFAGSNAEGTPAAEPAALASEAGPGGASRQPSLLPSKRESARNSLAPLVRSDSQRSNVSRAPPAVASPAPSAAGSVSQSPLNQSVAEVRSQGTASQAGGSQAGDDLRGSQRGSMASLRNSQSRGGASAAGAATVQEEEEEDLQGVDWRLTARTANEEVARLRGELAAGKERAEAVESENSELVIRVAELEAQLDEARHSLEEEHQKGDGGEDGAEGGKKAGKMKALLAKKEAAIKSLEAKLRHLGSRTASVQSVSEAQVPTPSMYTGDDADSPTAAALKRDSKAKDRRIKTLEEKLQEAAAEKNQLEYRLQHAGGSGAETQQLRVSMQQKDTLIQEAKAAILALETKLKNAQDAIVSATDYGWENDIKLAQARRALSSILDHHSPRRGGSKSPKAAREREQQRVKLAKKVEEVTEQKREAVQAEDYSLAQELHAELAVLKVFFFIYFFVLLYEFYLLLQQEQLVSIGSVNPADMNPAYPAEQQAVGAGGGAAAAAASPEVGGAVVAAPVLPARPPVPAAGAYAPVPAPAAFAADSPRFSPARFTVNTNAGYRSRGGAG